MHLLSDYIIDAHTRYEDHRLVYETEEGEPVELRGILGAAILGALLSVTDEAEVREIVLDSPEGRDAFFRRYEKEVLVDNGGLFHTEVEALNEAYLPFVGQEELLLRICRNDRLLDLAVGLAVEYMQRLVREQVKEHIYEFVPWTTPFAQWLFDAGHAETRRQALLGVDWTSPAEVFELSQQLSNDQRLTTNDPSPTFVFDGLSADQVLCGYWDWLWALAQKEANMYPDAKVQLAKIKQMILDNEINYDFLKPEMKHFSPEAHNLFRAWMNNWQEFVQAKIQPQKPKQQKKEEGQLFFPDEVLKCPTEDMEEKYAATREYVKERCKYDAKFRFFAKKSKFAEFCRQLTMLFGWYVDPNSLRKSLKRKPKRQTKKYV